MPAGVRASVLLNIRALPAKARSSGVPVIHIQHDGTKGRPLELHTESWNIHDSSKPAEGELVINKRESDSLFETTLQQELGRGGITHLIIADGLTEYCVDTTCRRATSLGYDVTLASDAHPTRQWSADGPKYYCPP